MKICVSRIKKSWLLIIALVIVLFTLFNLISPQEPSSKTLFKVHKGDIIEAVYGVGVVVPDIIWQLKVNQAAIIYRLYVKEGDQVKKGDPLADIATLKTFYAPFDGTITELKSKTHEMVFPQSIILTLTDLRNYYVEVVLEQKAAMLIKRGQKAKLNFEGLREQSFTGEVSAFYPKDTKFIAHIMPENLPDNILIGMTADVSICLNEHRNVLLVPIAALSNNNTLLVKSEKNIFRLVQVTTGIVNGEEVEIIQGDLKENDVIVIRNK